ncbi:putative reverse transcriptase domain-containing protein [Tanacetum coccineum]
MTKLTQKSVKFNWGEKEETAFQTLKQKLCSAPILALPEGSENFIVYCDASHKGLGAVLMQREKVIAYASRQLKIHEKVIHILCLLLSGRVEEDGGTRIQACFRDELDNVVEEEDGGWICFLGGNNSSGTKKYRGSNSSDGGDTGDGVKIVGEVIGSGGGIGDSTGVSVSLGGGISLGGKKFRELSIGGSDNTGDRGKMASEAKRYLDKLSEESGEMFLGEAGK